MKKRICYEVRLRGTAIILKSFKNLDAANTYSSEYNNRRGFGEFASYIKVIENDYSHKPKQQRL